MAFKDLQTYYDGVRNSYFNLLKILEDFDAKNKEGVPVDKAFKKFKKAVDRVKSSYETITYFFMLWSKPDKAEAELIKKWEEEHKEYNYLAERDPDKILAENKKLIEDIENYLKKYGKDK